jgi:hypothetical protein
MSISIVRLLVDFGLLVLIWMIQLIMYPSFLYYNTENLVAWHRKYTPLIGYIVGPLMLFQLGITVYQITNEINLFNIISLMIISLVWISTFLQFVPIHNSISKGRINKEMLLSLVKKNWIRTALWTILFLFSLTYYLF